MDSERSKCMYKKNYAELRTWSRAVNVNCETGGVYTLNELKGK